MKTVYVQRPHDLAGYNWLIERPYAGLFLDMASGKTATTATVMDHLLDRVEVSRWLVVSTPRIARVVWEDELNKWQHLEYLAGRYYHIEAEDLPVEMVKVTRKGEQQTIKRLVNSRNSRWELLNRKAEVFTIHFDLLSRLVQLFGDKWPFDGVILDESSLAAETDTERHRSVARIRGYVKRMYILTGTPASNGLEKLYGQVKLLDGGKRLGRTLTEFRERFMEPGRMVDRQGREREAVDPRSGRVWKWQPRPGMREVIYDAIKDICMTMDITDSVKLPEIVQNVILVDLPPAARLAYQKIEKDYIAQLQSGAVIEASTGAVLANKLLQICNGFAYDEDGTSHEIHSAKLDAVDELLQVTDSPVLLAYWFNPDRDRLKKKFKAKATVLSEDDDFEKKWNAGEIPLGMIQPASGGHGLNLQHGGHIACWFGPIYNLELVLQFNKRLPRPGQAREHVVVNTIIARDTLEEDVYYVNLQGKKAEQDALLEAVTRRVNKVTGRAE